MSFFGKLKTSVLHSGPPAPPRRTDNSSEYGWPEGEFDDEDTYEAPPCERPTIKVQPHQVEENVYLGYPDRTPNPVIPKRQAAPPPRPAKIPPIVKTTKPELSHDPEEFYIDPNDAPEVIRKDKPGKKAPPKRPPMRPPPVPQHDEDVYLDPNEGQDDDTYLEPAADCPPALRSPARMPVPRDPPPPIMKPPVPRAKSNSLLISESMNKVLPPEVKRSTLSGQLPPLALASKPVLPIIMPKEPKPSPPLPPSVDCSAPSFGIKSVTQPFAQEAGLQDREWFAGICDRKTAEETVLRFNKDGTFLVRCSNSQSGCQPYTLVVLFHHSVYNIPVRFLNDSHHYALGKEGKKTEELFVSLQEMISHHMKNPILLIDRKSQAKHTTYLSHPVRP